MSAEFKRLRPLFLLPGYFVYPLTDKLTSCFSQIKSCDSREGHADSFTTPITGTDFLTGAKKTNKGGPRPLGVILAC